MQYVALIPAVCCVIVHKEEAIGLIQADWIDQLNTMRKSALLMVWVI